MWQGTLSKEYEVRQGVGQGRILSPLLYKAYMDGPLAVLRESGHGIHIGATYMGSPACADDVLLACDRNSAQSMLDIAYDQACNRRFCIQPLKSTVSTRSGTDPSITLGTEILTHSQHITHLGITRNMNDISSLVADRIELARNTVYALMPTGMHGENGLSPVAIHTLIMTVVLPRMLHGLDSVILKQKDVQSLDSQYSKILCNLLSLREKVAKEAVYLLFGLLPIEAEIHVRVLTLYGAITRLHPHSPLAEVVFRQVSGQGNASSWFMYVRKIAVKYDIETTVLRAACAPWQAHGWKRLVNDTIRQHWFIQGTDGRSGREILPAMAWRPGMSTWQATSIVAEGGCCARTRIAASYRAKLKAGSYILQTTRNKFNQFEINRKSPLCQEQDEDLPHFLIECPALQDARKRHMELIVKSLKEDGAPLPSGTDNWCYFILNCGANHVCEILTRGERDTAILNKKGARAFKCNCPRLGQIMCWELHNVHSKLLQKAAPTHRRK